MKYQTIIFYIYRTIENPEILMERERAIWSVLDLKGRMIIAEEGINGTLEGTLENTEKYIEHMHADKRFKYLRFKKSESAGDTFPRISIKVRDEIVGTHYPKHVDPRVKTAPRVTAKQLHKWYEKGEDFVVVDMRNSYEIASGKFDKTIDPGMDASRELPQKIDKIRAEAGDKKILTVCTAGVRCEKMSAYLLDQGFENVYQLEDGIHGYIQKYPGENFKGALYTFDGRVTMDFTDERTVIGTCAHCKKQTEEYQNCANDECHIHFIVCRDCAESDSHVFCSRDCKETSSRLNTRVR